MINDLCELIWMVCVKGCHTNHPFAHNIHSNKTFIILSNTYYLVCVKGCNTESDKWFVWRGGWFVWSVGSHKPSTQAIPSHKLFIISLHTIHLSFFVLQIIWFVWRDMINCLCERLVCVKGCNTENDKWFVWKGLLVWMVCVNHPFTQTIHTNKIITHTIYHSLYYITSHKPSLHTNYLFTQTRLSHKPSLHTNHLSVSVLHYFTQTIPSHQPSLHTNHSSFSVLHIIWLVWLSGLCE